MGKKAVIDIGTNSVRLFIGQLSSGRIITYMKKVKTTRLGEGVDRYRLLNKEAVKRTIEALKDFIDIARGNMVEDVICFATSAVRNAENREDFIKEVRKLLGVEIKVLTGEQEALASFLGATFDWKCYGNQKLLLVDIGGGSTEVIAGNRESIEYKASFEIGAVRLTELFHVSYPVGVNTWNRMGRYIDEVLRKGWNYKNGDTCLFIGVGGTVTSLAAIDQGLSVYNPEKVHGYQLDRERVAGILAMLMELPLSERRKVAGLQPERADIILAGIHILQRVMDFAGADRLIVSDRDNLEGMLLMQSGFCAGRF